MDEHHQPDQSYRIPRRARAARVQARTQALFAAGGLEPGYPVDAPAILMGEDAPAPVDILASTSQPAAMGHAGKVGVLVFGSSTRPGGGWLNGARAQEEDISLASSWATQAAAVGQGFYAPGKGLGGLGPDRALVAQGVWFSDPFGVDLTAPRPVVFCGVAAPNLANPATAQLPVNVLVDHLARRLAGALVAWEQQGVSRVVMGAIGCGVFQWQPEDSAAALRKAIGHHRATGANTIDITLALPDARHAKAFAAALSATGRRRPLGQ